MKTFWSFRLPLKAFKWAFVGIVGLAGLMPGLARPSQSTPHEEWVWKRKLLRLCLSKESSDSPSRDDFQILEWFLEDWALAQGLGVQKIQIPLVPHRRGDPSLPDLLQLQNHWHCDLIPARRPRHLTQEKSLTFVPFSEDRLVLLKISDNRSPMPLLPNLAPLQLAVRENSLAHHWLKSAANTAVFSLGHTRFRTVKESPCTPVLSGVSDACLVPLSWGLTIWSRANGRLSIQKLMGGELEWGAFLPNDLPQFAVSLTAAQFQFHGHATPSQRVQFAQMAHMSPHTWFHLMGTLLEEGGVVHHGH